VLTVEGRIERTSMIGTNLLRLRQRRDRPLWNSVWAKGLWLILAALGLIIIATVVLSLIT
jgi:hypothetical protein